MEKQGVHGPKPSFITGNIMEMSSLVKRAVSQDMETIRHDIVGRILPHFVLWSNQYGMSLSREFLSAPLYVLAAPSYIFLISHD